MPTTLHTSDLPGLTLLHRGKVRDVYELPGNRLLMVATDRLSAFDVVLPDPIPGKGEMLCQISNFWFDKTAHLIPNHLTMALYNHAEVWKDQPAMWPRGIYCNGHIMVSLLYVLYCV